MVERGGGDQAENGDGEKRGARATTLRSRRRFLTSALGGETLAPTARP
jgi:hypothetical protein